MNFKKTKSPHRNGKGSRKGGRRTTFPRSPAVSSSRRGLTSLFGMGRGAPPRHSRHLYLIGLSRMGGKPTQGHHTRCRPPSPAWGGADTELKLSGH